MSRSKTWFKDEFEGLSCVYFETKSSSNTEATTSVKKGYETKNVRQWVCAQKETKTFSEECIGKENSKKWTMTPESDFFRISQHKDRERKNIQSWTFEPSNNVEIFFAFDFEQVLPEVLVERSIK